MCRFLPEALVVFLRGHNGRQEQLHVADGLLHDHVKHAQQGAPLIQHLLGWRCGEIPGNSPEHALSGNRQERKYMQTNKHRLEIQTQALIYSTKIKAAHYPESKLHDHRGWDLQSAAFDQSLQNVVHRAANRKTERVCECILLDGFYFSSHECPTTIKKNF